MGKEHVIVEKMIAFDVDKNLAPLNEAMPQDVARRAQAYQDVATVVLASGKPCAYLAGFARGAGFRVEDMPLIGENGNVVYRSGCMPPKGLLEGIVGDLAARELARARTEFVRKYGPRIFLQPNDVVVTPFPAPGSGVQVGELHEFAQGLELEGVQIWKHSDCIDIAPADVDKGVALRQLAESEGLEVAAAVAAVGDGDNDKEMLAVAGLGICVGDNPVAAAAAKKVVSHIHQAFDLLDEWLAS